MVHKPGRLHGRPDSLSRRPDHRTGVEQDKKEETTLLDSKFFQIRATGRGTVTSLGSSRLHQKIKDCPGRDNKVAAALDTILKSGPRSLTKGVEEWNCEDGLILFRGKVYVPKNTELRREIVKTCHDALSTGHPGRWKTLELVQREFWWPGMSVFVRDYVDGCATCQATKNQPERSYGPIQPNAVPEVPFQIITTDFVTDLPPVDGFGSINVVVDRFTKMIKITPCTKTITAEGTATLLLDHVMRNYGLPKQIISDRGPQFASKVMQEILTKLGVESTMSTAYHPQTDGETERVNQEVEQYLRAFCNHQQNNWVSLIPFAEFSHNIRAHAATGKAPFELLYGYVPIFTPPVNPISENPEIESRMKQLTEARNEAQASLAIAAEVMKRNQSDRDAKRAPFKNGDKVWLEGRNIHTTHPKAKLAPKRHGPFPITDVLGPVTYRLELPPQWRIHPVFHTSLLTPYRETASHGKNYARPPPDLIDDHEEFEVEKIVHARRKGRNRRLFFTIKWKGYPDADNTEQPADELENAQEAIADFYRLHPSAPHDISSLMTRCAALIHALAAQSRRPRMYKKKPTYRQSWSSEKPPCIPQPTNSSSTDTPT